jgi:diacylglycerol kinase
MMSSKQGWQQKFAHAAAGLFWSVRTQSSFWIHLPIAFAVLGVAAWLRVETWRWVAIVLAITIVLSAELLNTVIEQLVKVLHPDHDERIGQLLDTAAGAVLVAAIGAIIVGLIALGLPLWSTLLSLLA